MSGVRVKVAFGAGATIAAMVMGVARFTEVVEPATAVAEQAPARPPPPPQPPPIRVAPPVASAATERPPEAAKATPPAHWRAPQGAPEEVTAGVLAKVASQRAQAKRCEPAAGAERGRNRARRAQKAEPCPPEEVTDSIEIDWNGPPATR